MPRPEPARKTRVLVVSHAHPALSLGGAEIASHNLHKGLNALSGAESVFLARVGHPIPRHGATALMSLRQAASEILFHNDEYDHFYLSNRNTDEIERDLIRFVRDLAPDVVHFHHVLGLGLETLAAIRAALPKATILVTFHEFLSICHHHGQMVKTKGTLCERASPTECNRCFPEVPAAKFLRREHLVRAMLDLADAYVSPSAFLAQRFVEWGLPAARMHVIENGIDVAETAEPRPLAAGGRRGRFAFFGQMTPFKGIDVLIDAVARVPEKVWGEDARLLIFGGNLEAQPPGFQEKMKKLIEEAGARVRFYGAYRNAEMPRLMRSVDWVVMPSIWWENSPVVIQEAFHHGRPLIVSNIGGMAEKVRDGEDGLHFRVGSAEDLADRFAEVLTEPALFDGLRGTMRRPLSHLDCARAHLDLYRALAARGRTAARAAPLEAVPA